MTGLPFASTLRADKTLAAALGFIALVGLAELGAVAYYYVARTHAAYKVAQPTTPANPAALLQTEQPASVSAESSTASTSSASTAEASMTASDRLLREARRYRERGDTTTALARLQEILQANPKNAGALAEMAMIYESIQLYDRSNETWRRVQELGPAAGALYELADMKLKVGAAPASTPSSSAVMPFGADGIPEGSTFGITEVTPTQTNDPDADMHLVLRVAVKKRPEASIDYTKVKIQVFFYDTADNNQRVVLTDAEVNYEWLTPNHNWTESNPEVLAVTYLRSKKDALTSDAALTAAASEVQPPMPGKKGRATSKSTLAPESLDTGPRKYLGYIVRVYYKDQLQAVRAEPNRLLNLFPPPFTAPTQ
jgi:tetratricopeptide (TPR) repeat protein